MNSIRSLFDKIKNFEDSRSKNFKKKWTVEMMHAKRFDGWYFLPHNLLLDRKCPPKISKNFLPAEGGVELYSCTHCINPRQLIQSLLSRSPRCIYHQFQEWDKTCQQQVQRIHSSIYWSSATPTRAAMRWASTSPAWVITHPHGRTYRHLTLPLLQDGQPSRGNQCWCCKYVFV